MILGVRDVQANVQRRLTPAALNGAGKDRAPLLILDLQQHSIAAAGNEQRSSRSTEDEERLAPVDRGVGADWMFFHGPDSFLDALISKNVLAA
jgi:hypothetical protein